YELGRIPHSGKGAKNGYFGKPESLAPGIASYLRCPQKALETIPRRSNTATLLLEYRQTAIRFSKDSHEREVYL
ncbi:MAG: hypothetical protein ACREKL_12050, partial [Chthoniobacterales bacterium]